MRSGSSCAATSRRAGSTSRACRHVFCFDVPYHAEDYVHRIGRTGRAGRDGRSFTLAAPEDGKSVAAIQKLIGRDIPLVTIPGIETAELDFEGERGRGRRPARSRAAKPAPKRREDAPRQARKDVAREPSGGAASRREGWQRHPVPKTRPATAASRRAPR